jgi:branched-chain amino acid transport system substrate-binding protein
LNDAVRIGFAAPLSGPQAIVGEPMRRVVELAAADACRTGWNLEVVAADDQADEVSAGQVATALAQDPRVLAVVGHKNSGPSLTAAPVYAAAGLAQLSPSSTDNALSRSGWSTFFRLCADNESQAALAAEVIRRLSPTARVVAVHDGTAYGEPLVRTLTQRLVELGGQPVTTLAIEIGQQDFSTMVEAVARSKADVVYLGATEVEGGKLTRALREAGLEPQVIASEGGPFSPFPSLAGAAAEGSIHTYAGADPFGTAAARRLSERCRAEIAAAPPYLVECYDAVSVILAALKNGAASRKEVVDAIAKTDIEGVSGRIHFTPTGERDHAPVSLWQVEQGRMRALPRNANEGELN